MVAPLLLFIDWPCRGCFSVSAHKSIELRLHLFPGWQQLCSFFILVGFAWFQLFSNPQVEATCPSSLLHLGCRSVPSRLGRLGAHLFLPRASLDAALFDMIKRMHRAAALFLYTHCFMLLRAFSLIPVHC
jgi:hypothetical protein